MFRCGRCKTPKPRSEFYPSALQRQPASSWCKSCTNAAQRKVYALRPKRKRTTEELRRHNLKHGFNLTIADYDVMLAAQDRVCAVCKQPETLLYRGRVRHLAVDHDHETGAIRGLLCHNCNVSIGLLAENPDRMIALAAYVVAAKAATCAA